ncbi:symmetrical bis(5'-nucleosyl)-tetraphosphatase [Hahella ganghwensis]|uniref:symmetrical bis(5'-nucleosyl)-tetraphosphatase n=1 Tax=Hahella ganghwensis TaxID=286420 RepID=UPI000379DC49|nr:symmetrical bis(5'-nucleosyl)-tetraphosphatase [Hahella ganghwensis]
MSVYAIGDVQGCCEALERLLEKLKFDPAADQILFAGDLINRGPESLQTLRLIYSLRHSVMSVLGNHDLHALAVYFGRQRSKKKDTLSALYDAEDAEVLLEWLRECPLAHYDEERHLMVVHAGVPHHWSVAQTLSLAAEVEQVVRGSHAHDFFCEMYGNLPHCWNESLQGMERLRVITNYLTRMRFLDEQGCLELTHKQGLETAPEGFKAWFQYPRNDDLKILFGHWAAIQGVTGVTRFHALDTGCVWGGNLRAMNVDTGEYIEVESRD